MLKFIALSLKYNLSAHFSNLPNLIAGAFGIFINNLIFFVGMWGMLFSGHSANQSLLIYYVALNALMMTAWGGINFFFGGWIELGELITSGQFESKLSTPRHPLVLVSTHALQSPALGDLFMGILALMFLFAKAPVGIGIRTLIATGESTIALFSLYIFAGSLAFFIPKGNYVAVFVRELAVSLSSYPMGKIFPSGMGRVFLLLTPAAAISLLPMDWVETAGVREFSYSLLAVLITLIIAIFVYSCGVKRFQTINLIGTQG